MSKSIVHLAILIAFAWASSKLSFADDQPPNKSCRQHPQLSGPCFNLRGRLSYYNGTPSRRIWPMGSRRLLGISQGHFVLPGYANLPPELVDELAGFDNEMFADFLVCPFTDDRLGVMRLVCVEAAKNIFVRPRSGRSPSPK
jgi:hypothetical protein